MIRWSILLCNNKKAESEFISNIATVKEEMKYYYDTDDCGNSSNKHISHGQVYNQV